MSDAKSIVSKMTLEEKAAVCSGLNFWQLKSFEKYGLPSIMLTDGPHGLRKQAGESDHLGINQSVPATCFPAACATSSSFDTGLMDEIGRAMAEECQAEDVAVILGPGANIKRSPLCGRNFEYISEDPYLTGEMAAALINGVQSGGVGTSLKHYAANNQENARMTCSSVVDERALREIYLTGFEKAVKQSQPQTVMCSYNKVNGIYASENRELLTDILRTQWGFRGLVVTDWGAANDRVEGIKAGEDLEMPSSNGYNDARLVAAVQNGTLDENDLDTCAARVVQLILDYKQNHTGQKYDVEAHHALARRAAAESAVLLRNQDAALPLHPGASIAVLGQFAQKPRYQGAGSSKINPHRIDAPFAEMQRLGMDAEYADGYDLSTREVKQALVDEAVALARGKDAAVIFAGLPDEYESEGFDRTSLDMPQNHNALIEAVAAANPNTIVVLMCGAPVVMPWAERVKSILLMYLGGEAVGGAAADLLSGRANPGGKLAETFPLALEDNASYSYFPGTTRSVEYRESIFVGYRWYDAAKRPVAYPFGHGLSYTSFALSGLTLSQNSFAKGGTLTASVTVTNTGSVPGSETVQLYIGKAQSPLMRPEKELKGFARVRLAPGESQALGFTLEDRSFAYWNTATHDWAVEGGEYTILVGTSSRNIAETATVQVAGDGAEAQMPDIRAKAPVYFALPQSGSLAVSDEAFTALYGRPLPPSARLPGEPYSVNSTLGEIQDTFVGRQIKKMVQKQGAEMMGDSEDLKPMLEAMMNDIPLRSMVMMSNGAFTGKQLNGLVDLLNGKRVKGLVGLLKK